jgi:hypothetical protein
MSRRDIHVGGRFAGVSTRADGRVRANLLRWRSGVLNRAKTVQPYII